jgi:hypothetical protein
VAHARGRRGTRRDGCVDEPCAACAGVGALSTCTALVIDPDRARALRQAHRNARAARVRAALVRIVVIADADSVGSALDEFNEALHTYALDEAAGIYHAHDPLDEAEAYVDEVDRDRNAYTPPPLSDARPWLDDERTRETRAWRCFDDECAEAESFAGHYLAGYERALFALLGALGALFPGNTLGLPPVRAPYDALRDYLVPLVSDAIVAQRVALECSPVKRPDLFDGLEPIYEL